MMKLAYVTGNAIKFHQGSTVCSSAGITLEQVKLALDEIQAETGEPIARHKAAHAYAQLKTPLVVSDDSWNIPGLKGFPGPYMKYVNDWFTPNDWLRLTRNLTDRRVMLQQLVMYQDSAVQKVFSVEITATLLTEIRGVSPYPHSTVISYDGGKTSSAEHHAKGKSGATNVHNVWHDFTEWYIKEYV